MTSNVLAHVEMAPRDPILGVTEAFVADKNPNKVNLGVGIYYDDTGKVPVLECVRRAERDMAEKSAPRAYLPIDGLAAYDKAIQTLVFGADSPALKDKRDRHGADAGRHRRPQGRRRFPAPPAAPGAGLDQRSELGKPPRDIRKRRVHGQRLPLLRCADPRREFRRA